MNPYYFLFALAGVATIFAVIQDLKTREVSNWLNFSFIAIAFAYRLIFSYINNDWNFLLFGAIGFVLFYGLAYLFYYASAFAGGDAKHLMGYGLIIPAESMKGLFFYTGGFVFFLFFTGLLWSLIYSVKIILNNRTKFKIEFSNGFKKYGFIFTSASIVLLFSVMLFDVVTGLLIGTAGIVFSFLFVYAKALEKCMIKKVKSGKLTEGDWILNDIKVGGKTIKKSVHGLSFEDIRLLKKFNKEIYMKDGVPFTPAFLASLIIMVFFYLEQSAFPFLAFFAS